MRMQPCAWPRVHVRASERRPQSVWEISSEQPFRAVRLRYVLIRSDSRRIIFCGSHQSRSSKAACPPVRCCGVCAWYAMCAAAVAGGGLQTSSEGSQPLAFARPPITHLADTTTYHMPAVRACDAVSWPCAICWAVLILTRSRTPHWSRILFWCDRAGRYVRASTARPASHCTVMRSPLHRPGLSLSRVTRSCDSSHAKTPALISANIIGAFALPCEPSALRGIRGATDPPRVAPRRCTARPSVAGVPQRHRSRLCVWVRACACVCVCVRVERVMGFAGVVSGRVYRAYGVHRA